jgi:DNA-binding response OmpR family regulator
MAFPARILIVEDEELLAANLKALLDRHASDVRIASDAKSAVELLQGFTPELVVIDYALPGIDGLRAYQEIVRVSARRPACVMISGYLTELIAERVRRQGIKQMLCKPFSFADLKQAILATREDAVAGPLNSPLANRRLKERRSKQIGTCSANRRVQPTRRGAGNGRSSP